MTLNLEGVTNKQECSFFSLENTDDLKKCVPTYTFWALPHSCSSHNVGLCAHLSVGKYDLL